MSVISLKNLLVCPKKQFHHTCGVSTAVFDRTFYPFPDLISPLAVILSAVRLNKHPCVPPSPVLASTLHSSPLLPWLAAHDSTWYESLPSRLWMMMVAHVASAFASAVNPPCLFPQLSVFEPLGSHAVVFLKSHWFSCEICPSHLRTNLGDLTPPSPNSNIWGPSTEAMGTIVIVFGMTQPKIQPTVPLNHWAGLSPVEQNNTRGRRMVEWLALSLHSKRFAGWNPGTGAFLCRVFTFSLCLLDSCPFSQFPSKYMSITLTGNSKLRRPHVLFSPVMKIWCRFPKIP